MEVPVEDGGEDGGVGVEVAPADDAAFEGLGQSGTLRELKAACTRLGLPTSDSKALFGKTPQAAFRFSKFGDCNSHAFRMPACASC